MATITLQELIDRVKSQIDLVDSDFATDAELTIWLNDSVNALHDMFRSFNPDMDLTSTQFSTVAQQEEYDLPADFVELRGVDVLQSGETTAIRPYGFNERNKYKELQPLWAGRYSIYEYRLSNKLSLIPTPNEVVTVTLWYIALPAELVDLTDEWTYQTRDWTRWVVVDAAIKSQVKSEEDASMLMLERERVENRLAKSVSRRHTGMPRTPVDTRRW